MMAKEKETVETKEASVQEDKLITISFNTNELEVLVNMLDSAVRAKGLNAAQGGFVLASKVQQALSANNVSNG